MFGEKLHPVDTDKDGQKVSTKVSNAVGTLRDKTRNLQVICHNGDTGRIGFWSKSPCITKEQLDIAQSCDYELDFAKTRQKGGKTRGYCELVPKSS